MFGEQSRKVNICLMGICYLIEEQKKVQIFTFVCLALTKWYFSPVHPSLLVPKFISPRLTHLVMLVLWDSEYNISPFGYMLLC